jgi:hypothetical protein
MRWASRMVRKHSKLSGGAREILKEPSRCWSKTRLLKKARNFRSWRRNSKLSLKNWEDKDSTNNLRTWSCLRSSMAMWRRLPNFWKRNSANVRRPRSSNENDKGRVGRIKYTSKQQTTIYISHNFIIILFLICHIPRSLVQTRIWNSMFTRNFGARNPNTKAT